MYKYSSQSTIPDALALLTPILLLVGLALGGGGGDLFARHVVGILVWLAIAALVLTRRDSEVRLGKPALWIAGLLLTLGLVSALSSLWSGSTAQSLVEAERLITHLGFFLVGYLVCRTPSQRQRFVEGVTIALGVILLMSMSERLYPGLLPLHADLTVRLSFPMGYWNANGLIFGMAMVLFVWMSRAADRPWLRWASIAFIPLAMSGLYLTYSRGGALSAVIAGLCLFFLSRDRLWLITVAGIGVACGFVVLRTISANEMIAKNLTGDGATSEGLIVMSVLLAAMVAAPVAFYCVLQIARSRPGFSGQVVRFSRDSRVMKTIGGTMIVAFAVITIGFGGHAWERYSDDTVDFPQDPGQQFTKLSGTGRYEFNQVALNAFKDDPVIGIGAGSYRFEWAQERSIPLVAQNAHSLYLEFLAELGIVGAILILALIISFLYFAAMAWRVAGSSSRTHVPVIASLLVALAIAFAFDWMWQLGGAAALLMLIGAWLTASFEGEPDRRRGRRNDASWTRIGLVGLAWVAIVALALPAIADRYMEASSRATARGDLEQAIDYADTASSLNPWIPAPYLQKGAIAESLGLYPRAINYYSKAIELEPDNWQLWYLRLLAEHESGDESAAQSDLREARRLNPMAPQLTENALLDTALQP